MFKLVLVFVLSFTVVVKGKTETLLIDGKYHTVIEKSDEGIVKAYAYRATPDVEFKESSVNEMLCGVFYNCSYSLNGWNVLYAQTNPHHQTDEDQAHCVGVMEGVATATDIHTHYHNVVKPWCHGKGRKQTCNKVKQFLKEHFVWVQQSIQEHGNRSGIWHHVNVFYNHVKGLHTGYLQGIIRQKWQLTLEDFLMMNLMGDLDDIASAIEGDTSASVRGDSHCSALIKLLPDNQDLLVGHVTWTSYTQMFRTLKFYDMPLRTSSHSKMFVPGRQISFSGYPGVITSGDDFYLTSAGLVALETTIGNSNASLWNSVTATGKLLETVRSLIALRLANNGRSWCETFSDTNSGTYNNQWMIVDLNKFKKGQAPEEGTLYVLEQIPGYIRFEDQTDVLKTQTYWASYNSPFYTDVFNMSGNAELVQQYGQWFSYNNTARANIFRRDHSSVSDLDSLMSLMRSNNYEKDLYSRCNCTPPYSAENAISARSDLNPKDGVYPFSALGHRAHGATDAKVVSPQLAAQNLSFVAVCGPTNGNNLPPFRWSHSDFKHLPHKRQPNSFTNFKPIIPDWYGPIF